MNDVVIVAGSPRVARNAPLSRLRGASIGRAVWQAEHDDAPRLIEDVSRMLISLFSSGDVVHLARVTSIEPLAEVRDARGSDRGTDSDQREAETAGFGYQVGGEVACRRVAMVCQRIHGSSNEQSVGNAVGKRGLVAADFDGNSARFEPVGND